MTDRIGLPDNACNRHKRCESVLCLVLDRVYRCGDGGAPVFIEVDAPTDDELHALLQTLIKRLMLLTRRGVLVADMGQ